MDDRNENKMRLPAKEDIWKYVKGFIVGILTGAAVTIGGAAIVTKDTPEAKKEE